MRRDREDELDFADIGGEANAATHGASIAPRGRRPKPLAVAPVAILAENRLENVTKEARARAEPTMFFTFPEDARWNAERQAAEFGVEVGEYRGVVRVPRRVFQRLLPSGPLPSGASRLIISSGPGLRASLSGSCAGGS